MSAVALPACLADVTPAWLSQALGVPVKTMRIEREIHGTATKAKLALDYGGDAGLDGPPRVLWLKAGMEPHSEFMGAAAGIYEGEARFYAELRPQLDIVAPRCWFAAHDARTRQGVLLIEDLDGPGARFFNADFQPTLGQVRKTLGQLARLHAKWWDSPLLEALSWLEVTFTLESGGADYFRSHSEAQLAHFMSLPRGAAMPGITRDPARLFKAFWTLVERMGVPPRCLLHTDAHFGNTYLLPDGAVGYVDWQTPRKGCWAHDVAYYLGSALAVEDRRRHERELLAEYLDTLRSLGGHPPDFDGAWLEYRRNAVYGLLAWLLNPESDGFQPEPLNLLCVTRHSAAVADLESFAALGV